MFEQPGAWQLITTVFTMFGLSLQRLPSSYRNKICVLGITDGDNRVDLFDELLFLVVFEGHEPLGQASFACPVLYENEANL